MVNHCGATFAEVIVWPTAGIMVRWVLALEPCDVRFGDEFVWEPGAKRAGWLEADRTEGDRPRRVRMLDCAISKEVT